AHAPARVWPGEGKGPAAPTTFNFFATGCGAESVPRKKQASPDVAASTRARRSLSVLITGMQYMYGRRPDPSQSVRFRHRWYGVIVPPSRGACARTKSTAIFDQRGPGTTLEPGKSSSP